jgi:hypothetical protein
MENIESMKLLLNDKEIANYLSSLIDVRDAIKSVEFKNRNLEPVVEWILEKMGREGGLNIAKFKLKFKEKLYSAIRKDLETYIREVKEIINLYRKDYYTNINKHTDYFLHNLGEQTVIDLYKESNVLGFIKSVGLHIDPNGELVRRKNFDNVQEDCLLRNTVGNENIIVNKIDNNLPFWFIDSGYTNFVEPNKKWHRLTRNHLHFNKQFIAPADRLKNFPVFPRPWRMDGKKILIVEPGEFAAGIMHVDAKSWTEQVCNKLKKYTDRPIEIRSKINKKTRTSLYQQLLTGDYYCTVSINSNSAVESIWAGIPAITLDKHVSNYVTRNDLAQINDLYYGPLGDWLAWLSYCQFTYDELIDGTALDVVKKYHV